MLFKPLRPPAGCGSEKRATSARIKKVRGMAQEPSELRTCRCCSGCRTKGHREVGLACVSFNDLSAVL
jgi:hypothetical protein